MKYCIKCGSVMNDEQQYCNACGYTNSGDMTVRVSNQNVYQSIVTPTQMQMNNQQGMAQPQMQMNNQAGMMQSQMQMNNQAGMMQPQMQMNNQTAMFQNQMNSHNVYGKKKNNKGLIIGIISAVVVIAILLVVFLVIKPGKKSKNNKKIEERVEIFFEALNDENVDDLADVMIAPELAKKILVDYGYPLVFSNEEDWKENKKDFKKNVDRYYKDLIDSLEYVVEEDDIEIEIENLNIGSIEKTDCKKLVEECFEYADEDEIEGYDQDDVYEKFEKYCKQYEIDMDTIKKVQVEYDCEVEVDGDGKVDGVNIAKEAKKYFKYVYTYEYKDEIYVLPGIEELVMEEFDTGSSIDYEESNAIGYSTEHASDDSGRVNHDGIYELESMSMGELTFTRDQIDSLMEMDDDGADFPLYLDIKGNSCAYAGETCNVEFDGNKVRLTSKDESGVLEGTCDSNTITFSEEQDGTTMRMVYKK